LGHVGAFLGHLGFNMQPKSKNDWFLFAKVVDAVVGHLGAILGQSCALLGPSWGPLGAILEPSWVTLGPSWGHLGPFRSHFGAIFGLGMATVGAHLCHLGAFGNHPGKNWLRALTSHKNEPAHSQLRVVRKCKKLVSCVDVTQK